MKNLPGDTLLQRGELARLVFLHGAVAAALGLGVAESSARAADARDRDFGPVTRVVERMVEGHDLVGAGLILLEGEKEVYHRYFGQYDEQSVIRIASASKWLAVVAVMTLVDEGKIGLDDPVSKYIPSFQGEKAGITIRQCLSCTAGLPSRVGGINEPGITMELCVDNIAKARLLEPPGTRLRYGGCGFQVAARVAEVVTEQTWYELFHQRVKCPLNMATTRYGVWTCGDGPGGTGANRRLQTWTKNPWVAGTAETSLPHYAHLVAMLNNRGAYRGKRVLSEKWVAEILKNQSAGLKVGYVAPGGRNCVGYGLGTWIWRVDEEGNTLEASDPGGAGFTPWVDPDIGLAGVLMIDHPYPIVQDDIDLLRRVARAVTSGGEIPEIPPPARGRQRAAGLVGRVLGLLDRNQDGALSRDEIPRNRPGLRSALDRLDADDDGVLNEEELGRALRPTGSPGERSR